MLANSPYTGFGGCTCFWNQHTNRCTVELCVSCPSLGSQEDPVWLRPSQQLWPICMCIFWDQKLSGRLCTAHWHPWCMALLQESCPILIFSAYGGRSCSSGFLTNQFPGFGEHSRQMIHWCEIFHSKIGQGSSIFYQRGQKMTDHPSFPKSYLGIRGRRK